MLFIITLDYSTAKLTFLKMKSKTNYQIPKPGYVSALDEIVSKMDSGGWESEQADKRSEMSEVSDLQDKIGEIFEARQAKK